MSQYYASLVKIERPAPFRSSADYAARGKPAAQSRIRKGWPQMTKLRFIGLDVHAETIAVAVASREARFVPLGTIPNGLESVRKMIGKLGPVKELRACYEAGPTGYVLYWQLTAPSVECQLVAPTLVAVKAGDRVKTDRRDAEKLARCHRAGDLTPV
jgi:transposase